MRRTQLAGARRRQVVVRFSDGELARIRHAADVAGKAVGAWIGDATVRASEQPGRLADSSSGIRQLIRLRLDAAAAPDVAAVLRRLDTLIADLVDRADK